MEKHHRSESNITQVVTDFIDITFGIIAFLIVPILIVVAIIAAICNAL